MPQPSLISGVAGTVHSEAYQGPDVGEKMVAMAEAFSKMKEAHQAAAQKKLETMMNNVDKLPIDEKAIRKVAKQAGLPLADDDTIKAIATAHKASKAGPAAPATGTPKASTDATVKPPDAGDPGSSFASAAAAQKKYQENMTPDQAKMSVFQTFVGRAKALAAASFDTQMSKEGAAKAKAEMDTHVSSLMNDIMSGDQEKATKAMGTAMGMGMTPFNITQLALANSSPDQRKTIYNLAQNHEVGQLASDLIKAGHTPTAAIEAAQSIIAGKGISSETAAALSVPSFKQLSDEAESIQNVMQLGASPEQASNAVTQARHTGKPISEFLPKGLKSVFDKQMEMKNKELAIQDRHVDVLAKQADSNERRTTAYERSVDSQIKERKSRTELGILKLQIAENNITNKETLDAYKMMVQQKAKGVNVDPKELQKITDKLLAMPDMKGMTPEDLQHITNALSGTPEGAKTAPGGDAIGDNLD